LCPESNASFGPSLNGPPRRKKIAKGGSDRKRYLQVGNNFGENDDAREAVKERTQVDVRGKTSDLVGIWGGLNLSGTESKDKAKRGEGDYN